MNETKSLIELAQAGRLLAAPMRLRILQTLLGGSASVSELAAKLDVDRHRISEHLMLLRRDGLLTVRRKGRLSIYSVKARRTRLLLRALSLVSIKLPRRPAPMPRPRRRTPGVDLRQIRTCYDHLAGSVGVYLLREFLRRRWLTASNDAMHYRVTTKGAHALVGRGVNVFWAARTRRKFAFACPDWSDRHAHLAGAMGAAILEGLIRSGAIRLEGYSRQARLLQPLAKWLDSPRRRAGAKA